MKIQALLLGLVPLILSYQSKQSFSGNIQCETCQVLMYSIVNKYLALPDRLLANEEAFHDKIWEEVCAYAVFIDNSDGFSLHEMTVQCEFVMDEANVEEKFESAFFKYKRQINETQMAQKICLRKKKKGYCDTLWKPVDHPDNREDQYEYNKRLSMELLETQFLRKGGLTPKEKLKATDPWPLEAGLPLNDTIFVLTEQRGSGRAVQDDNVILLDFTLRNVEGTMIEQVQQQHWKVSDSFPKSLVGVLTRMHVGDRWKVVMPPHRAYDKIKKENLPLGSHTIFELGVIKVISGSPGQFSSPSPEAQNGPEINRELEDDENHMDTDDAIPDKKEL